MKLTGDPMPALELSMKQDQAHTAQALNDLFRSGKLPDPALDGFYSGSLVRMTIFPVVTQVSEWMASQWLPWKGKVFDAARHTGINVLSRDSLVPARLLWPFYHAYAQIGAETYRAFSFRTYVAPGLSDRDRSVFKIDYNLKGNPSLSVRRVLDELVQIEKDVYLGKAHFHWWWAARGKWQTVAYFLLRGGMR